MKTTEPSADKKGTTLINHWQCGVPVTRGPVLTPFLLLLIGVAAIGLGLAALRLFSPLGPFSAMNDVYAWGIWKTFNVMTLTALGSGPLALGIAAWVFNRQKLHVVMRTALVSGFLFYATGLIALGFDVGRPWNFYSAAMPWRWNSESAMLEISICMPLYCAVFLSFEIIPLILERVYYTGGERSRALLCRVAPIMPLLYLIAAGFCGIGFTIFLLMIVCLRYGRNLDAAVLAELANLLSGVCFVFLAIRIGDLIWRQQLSAAFAFDKMSLLFLFETAMILAPALALRFKRVRETPRALLNMSAIACLGGMLYRFIPTSIAYIPLRSTAYFPSVPELVMAAGYIAMGSVAFVLAVNYFAVLPGEASTWDHTFRPFGWPGRAAQSSISIPVQPKVATERAI